MAAIRRRGRSGLEGLIQCLKEEAAYKALVEEIEKGTMSVTRVAHACFKRELVVPSSRTDPQNGHRSDKGLHSPLPHVSTDPTPTSAHVLTNKMYRANSNSCNFILVLIFQRALYHVTRSIYSCFKLSTHLHQKPAANKKWCGQ